MAHRAKHHRPKYKGRNWHHIRNVVNRGGNEDWNLILLKIERHEYLHKIFGNRDLDQIIEVLCRVRRWKRRQQ